MGNTEPFELFLKEFFSTEKSFEVDIQGDDFPKVDLIIKNKDKSLLNYDFIFIEAKNKVTIKEDDVLNFINDVSKDNFKKFNILGLFCVTKEFPTDHYKKILESKILVIPFDKKEFESFFNSSYSIGQFLNLKINRLLDIQKNSLISEEMALVKSVKSDLKNNK